MSKLKIAFLIIIGVVGIFLNGLWLYKSGKMPPNWVNFLGMGNMPTSEETLVKSAISGQETAINEWVGKLAKMENCDPLGTMDSDGTLSYGKYCYKPGTFLYFVRRYELLPQAEDEEVQNWINDNDFQDKLTLTIIENEPESWTHWRNSVLVYKGREGIGLPPNI